MTTVSYDNLQIATNIWNNIGGTAMYETEYTYDGSGNILTLNREDHAGTLFDELTYTYPGGTAITSNRLMQVNDNIGGSTPAYADLAGTGAHDYTYDKLGNLTRDPNHEE